MPAAELCGTCRARGTCRLGLGALDVDERRASAEAPARCPTLHAGGPGIAHGGWTAAVFDDVLGRLPGALGERVVTAELQVAYDRPVAVEVDVVVRARLTGRDGRRRQATGELLLAATQEVLATAQALLVVVDEGHVARSRSWLQERGVVPRAPVDLAGTADDVAASLPEDLRATFRAEHRRLLDVWAGVAAGPSPSRRTGPSPARPGEPAEWAGLMDDWEL